MKPPKPIVAYEIETGNAVRHASVRAAEKACGVSQVYLQKRVDSGKPAKGFLFYSTAKAYSPEAIRQVRKLSPAFDAAFKAHAKKPDHEISVRIDPRTVVMVKASKWTPDFAERYKARMEASRPQGRPHTFVDMNDTLNQKRKGRK